MNFQEVWGSTLGKEGRGLAGTGEEGRVGAGTEDGTGDGTEIEAGGSFCIGVTGVKF